MKELILRAVRAVRGDKPIDIRIGNRTIRVSAQHDIYAWHDLRRSEYFEQIWESVEDNNGLIDCSTPRVHRYRDGNEFFLTMLPEEMSAIGDYMATGTGDLVFDIGAYCGVSTFHFAKRAAMVVAIEPDPKNFAALERNVANHNLSNVVCINKAVSAHGGSVSFDCEGALGSGIAKYHSGERISGSRREVPATTLADLVSEFGIPSLVKMDIEGAEVEVLGASLQMTKQWNKTSFVLEQHGVDCGDLFSGYRINRRGQILRAVPIQ
jgi:FkbM family methyltransferase